MIRSSGALLGQWMMAWKGISLEFIIKRFKKQSVKQYKQNIRFFYKEYEHEVASTIFKTSNFSSIDKDLCVIKVSNVAKVLITCSINNSSTG
jgi:hypothetical protein